MNPGDQKEFSISSAEPNLKHKYLQGNLNASYNFDSFVFIIVKLINWHCLRFFI